MESLIQLDTVDSLNIYSNDDSEDESDLGLLAFNLYLYFSDYFSSIFEDIQEYILYNIDDSRKIIQYNFLKFIEDNCILKFI